MALFRWIDLFLRKIALWCIRLYQHTLSPDNSPLFRGRLGGTICAHEPHCSDYAKQCFQRYSFFRALSMSVERVSHCHPAATKTYDPASYRIVFFSSAPIGIPFLEEITEDKRFDLVGVVTMPDAPSGRGMKVQENVIKQHSQKLELLTTDIQTPHSLRLDSKKYAEEAKEFKQRIEAKQPDMCVVIAYGKLLPKWLLDFSHFGTLNVRGSLLPAYRGASPLQSAFLDGKLETGITIMLMDEGLDTGSIIETVRTPLPLERTVKKLIERITEKWPKFLTKTMWQRWKSYVHATPQDESQVTLCSKFTKADGEFDPLKDDLLEVYQKWQAFAIRPKISFIRNKKRVTVEWIKLKLWVTRNQLATTTLFHMVNDQLLLADTLQEVQLKPEWKKIIWFTEFVHGYAK